MCQVLISPESFLNSLKTFLSRNSLIHCSIKKVTEAVHVTCKLGAPRLQVGMKMMLGLHFHSCDLCPESHHAPSSVILILPSFQQLQILGDFNCTSVRCTALTQYHTQMWLWQRTGNDSIFMGILFRGKKSWWRSLHLNPRERRVSLVWA